MLLAAGGLQLAAVAAFVLARRSFGRRQLKMSGGKIHFSADENPIVPARVKSWTLSGSTARLYEGDMSWKIVADLKDEGDLRNLLSRLLGKPLLLHPRGSRRARAIALSVCLVGVLLVAVALGLSFMPLFPVGVLGAMVGGATFGALSQRVAGARRG